MKRWEILLAIAGALLTGLSAWTIHRTALPHRIFVLSDGGCQTPTTVVEPYSPKIQGAAVVFHGLSANRRVMESLGNYLATEATLRVYLVDLPGHGDNTDGFSFARAQQCATVAVESLIRRGAIDPKATILVGHSMGGAIAIRMADIEPVAATIAISPAPMILPRRMPSNLLVFSAQYDLGILKRQAQQLLQAAGGERTDVADFSQQRAFHVEMVPRATHTSLILDPQVARQSGYWIDDALQPGRRKAWGLTASNDHLGWNLYPREPWDHQDRLLLLATSLQGIAPGLGLIGLLLLFPICVAIAAKLAGPARAELPEARPGRVLALVEGLVCALVAVLILTLATPLKFLHLYTGDYLASLLLIAGALLLALNWKATKNDWSPKARPLIAAAVLGLAVMLAFGAWLNWQLTDMWLNAPRWLRFAAVLPVAWIFCYAEEVVLGPVYEGKRRALRYATFLALRLELWLACVLAYYQLANGQVLIPILVTGLAVFSVLQRLGTDALRRRTGSATAAALFGAILAAWFIAAVFPLT